MSPETEARLNELANRFEGRELFKESNDRARKFFEGLKYLPDEDPRLKHLFKIKSGPPMKTTEESKDFFKAVSGVSVEEVMESANIGAELEGRWLTKRQRQFIALEGRTCMGEVLDKTADTILCKLYRTSAAGVNCTGWFSIRDFVSTFQVVFRTEQ